MEFAMVEPFGYHISREKSDTNDRSDSYVSHRYTSAADVVSRVSPGEDFSCKDLIPGLPWARRTVNWLRAKYY